MDIETLVVTDLDGTLWDTTMVCHPRTLEAVHALDQAGVGLLVATGRRAESARTSLEHNGLVLPSVLLNGSLGVDFRTGETFHHHPYAADDVTLVLEMLGAHGLSPCLYTADGLMQVSQEPSSSGHHLESVGLDVRRHDDLTAAARDLSVLGMSILGIEHDRVAEAAQALRHTDLGEVALYTDDLFDGWSLMVQPPGISKWRGIQAWLSHSNVNPDRIVAIGDGGNDVEMLDAADIGVAVAGANSGALACAEVVIGRPETGGWADVLDIV
jgi:Cof subfamily protein (haloacid dehalogenase superfamily)